MTIGPALRLGLATGLIAVALARGAEPPAGPVTSAEVRIRSLRGQPTVVTVQAAPSARVEDETPGAKPPTPGQGPASIGDTFSDEITFLVHGVVAARPASIDVGDALVSTVRLFPESDGTQVVVFVRQPVSYTINQPTASGAVEVSLRPRTIPKPAPAHAGERIPAPAKPGDVGGDQVAVDAAELSYDQQANVLIARGGVTLTRGETTLRADEVRYDRTRSVAEAYGHVVIVDPDAAVEGDSASLDMNDETGWIDGVQGDMKQSPYRLNAAHAEKRGGPCYGIVDGVFTTCRCGSVERPSWSIAAKQADVTVGGIGVAKDATFRVNDVPVFYTPYLLFPANTERQSGLLMPTVSYSNRRGFVYEQPIYWAINKSSDATFTPDLETAARVGFIGEYRYVWSQNSHGWFTGGYFNQRIGGSPEPLVQFTPSPDEIPTNRWVVAGRHRTRLNPLGQLYLDVLRISDDNFLREIRAFSSNVSTDVSIRSTRMTRSRAGIVQEWSGGQGAATLDFSAYQDLIDSQIFSLNRVPQLATEQSWPLLNGLVVARVPGQAVDFQRESGFDGLRGDIAPELFMPFHWDRFVSGSVRGQVRETAYHLTNTQQVATVVPDSSAILQGFARNPDLLPDLKTDHTREIAQVEGRVGTEVARVYPFNFFGLDRIRHSIEPEVQYLYVPQVTPELFQANLPPCTGAPTDNPGRNCNGTLFSTGYLFDEVDAIRHRNFFSYGLTTRILGRAGNPIPETPTNANELSDIETGLVPADADFDEEDAGDLIDPDTLPQGLSANAIPQPAPSKPATSPGTPTVAPVTTASRELLRVSLLQGYDFSRQIVEDSHFSDVDATVRATPTDWLGFSYNSSVDVVHSRLLAQSVGAIVREPWWTPPPGRPSFQSPTSVGIAYRFIAQNVNGELPVGTAEQRLFQNGAVEDLSGSVYIRMGDYLGFGFLGRYSLAPAVDSQGKTIGPGFLERDYFVRLTSPCACWAVEVGVADRSDTHDTTARVQLVLYGLGSFGQGPVHGGYAAIPGLQGLGLRRPTALGRDY